MPKLREREVIEFIEKLIGRGERIRTSDPLLPKQMKFALNPLISKGFERRMYQEIPRTNAEPPQEQLAKSASQHCRRIPFDLVCWNSNER